MKEKRAFRALRGNKRGMSGGRVEVRACVHHNLKSVSVGGQFSFPLSLCHSHFLFPSDSHSHPSLQLRINFSVSIWLVPSALLSSPLSAFSNFSATSLPRFPYFPLRSQSFLLDLFGWCRRCVPLVNKSVCLHECLFVFIQLCFLLSAPLVSFVCGREVDKYN